MTLKNTKDQIIFFLISLSNYLEVGVHFEIYMESIIDMELKEEERTITKRKKSIISTTVKVFLWIIASVLFLIMLVLILIQTSFVQNFARKKIVSYLQNKLNTKVK